MSVWLVEDDHANLERIVAALAAGRMKLDKLDFALIDQRALQSLELQITPKRGDSCDDGANTLCHQDVRGLSGTKLLGLAIAMHAHGEFRRVLKSSVAALIAASIQHGFIDPNRIDERLRKDLPALPDVPS